MIYDYLLVGHGLAGSILAQTFSQNKAAIMVLDLPKANSASQVAAGLVNPLAGKRFAKSWLADVLVPYATGFYQDLEIQTGRRFYFQKPILKLFSSPEEQNNWMGKSADGNYGDFIKEVHTSLPLSEEWHQELGGIEIDRGGYLDVPIFLQSLREIREGRGELRSESCDFHALSFGENLVQYKDITAKRIIFCEGFEATSNPLFSWLPFSPNKGEVLDIETELSSADYIYNKGVYVLGINPGQWRVGATYNWREVSEEITLAGREELATRLAGLLKMPYRVIRQRAGIRPAVRDRRPLIGIHPHQPLAGIFNGMGSKGVMLAPYLAGHFGRYLKQEEELRADVNILRYLSLYKEFTRLP